MNVPVVCPAAIVTVAGTVAALVLELARLMTSPPVGAGPEIVTEPVTTVDELPCTVVGLRVKELRIGALTVKVPVLVVPGIDALIVDGVFALTGVVVIVKGAITWPAATVTDAGMVAAGLLDESVTTVPPAGAGDAS